MDVTTPQTARNAATRASTAAFLFGAAHLLVDLATISTLYTAVRSGFFSQEWAAVLILGYDFAAFAAQPFFGYAVDRLNLSGPAAALGCGLAALGAWLTPLPVAAVALVSLGNALFHVGGGSACLRLSTGKAVWAGVFVAPGAVGLFLGKQIGGTALFQPWALTLLLAAGVAASLWVRLPQRTEQPAFPQMKSFGVVLAAILITVALRSLVGFSVSYPWASGWPQALALTVAVFAGKALGGALADRAGWRTMSVAGLLLSAPLLAFGAGVPALALAGLFCFNLTMAVTLAGTAAMLPGYEGFAFGLTAASIIVGMSPSVLPAWKPLLGSPAAILGMITLSAAALWCALGALKPHTQDSPAKKQNGGFFDAQ